MVLKGPSVTNVAETSGITHNGMVFSLEVLQKKVVETHVYPSKEKMLPILKKGKESPRKYYPRRWKKS